MERMIKIFRIINNEKGASSVLVVFLMIVMVTLGAFSITAANSNIKFSKKAVQWNKDYYELDSQAERLKLDLETKLSVAELFAVEYVINGGYSETSVNGVEEKVQQAVKGIAAVADPLYSEEAMQEILNIIYFDMLLSELESLRASYANITVAQSEGEDFIRLSNNFTKSGDDKFNLDVEIKIAPVLYEFETDRSGKIIHAIKDISTEPYAVLRWKQWQKPFDYGSGFGDLWNGVVE